MGIKWHDYLRTAWWKALRRVLNLLITQILSPAHLSSSLLLEDEFCNASLFPIFSPLLTQFSQWRKYSSIFGRNVMICCNQNNSFNLGLPSLRNTVFKHWFSLYDVDEFQWTCYKPVALSNWTRYISRQSAIFVLLRVDPRRGCQLIWVQRMMWRYCPYA